MAEALSSVKEEDRLKKYIQDKFRYIKYKANTWEKGNNILTRIVGYQEIALELNFYIWLLYQTIVFGYENTEFPTLYETVFKMASPGNEQICTGYLFFEQNFLDYNHEGKFDIGDQQKLSLFVDKIHDKLSQCKIVAMYTMFRSNFLYIEPVSKRLHVNMILIFTENDTVIFSVYEPHGAFDGQGYEIVHNLVNEISSAYSDKFHVNVSVQAKKDISPLKGMQYSETGIYVGYCIMFSLLWMYMVIDYSYKNNTSPGYIIKHLEKTMISVLGNKENRGKLIISFATYVFNTYIEDLFLTDPEKANRFMDMFKDKFDYTYNFWDVSKMREFSTHHFVEQPADKKDGEQCYTDNECISGNCINGICVSSIKDPDLDNKCRSDQECKSNICVILPNRAYGHCSETKPDGRYCDTDNECMSGFCMDKTCVSREKYEDVFPPAMNGSDCKEDYDCMSGYCSPDEKCEDYIKQPEKAPSFLSMDSHDIDSLNLGMLRAIEQGQDGLAKLYISAGANDFIGGISVAAGAGNIPLVEYFIEDLKVDNSREHVFFSAIVGGHLPMIKYLEKKYSLNGLYWDNILDKAAQYRGLNIIKYILETNKRMQNRDQAIIGAINQLAIPNPIEDENDLFSKTENKRSKIREYLRTFL